jgi:hypothetical protein
MTDSLAFSHNAGADAREADRRQADYYRQLLTHQREAVETHLAAAEADFANRIAGNLRTIKRLRREIRRKQTERNTLDHLIAALEQRLTAPAQE